MAPRVLALLRQQPIAVLALFVALGGSSYAAVAAKPGQGDVITGCVAKDGKLRVVTSASRCTAKESAISFNREGKQGASGSPGAAGRDGADGAAGNDGAPGRDGATGPAGRDGSSTGTAGPAGPTGPAGAPGATGATGPAGATGAIGPAGPAGANGATGGIGPAGPTGATGADGQSVTGAAEAAGANCPAGGIRYTAANGTRYVCNGSPDSSATVLGKLLAVDGPGSGLDADTVDGVDFGALFGTGSQGTDMGLSGGGESMMGQVMLTATNYPPPGFVFAAGQTLPISQYSALFALLGTTYGGNGTTTFKLPDLRKQAPGGMTYILCYSGMWPSRP